MHSALETEAKNTLLLEEIKQYHAVIKDFSNQSASIKKVSITIFISFVTLLYGSNSVFDNVVPKSVFFIIGIMIPILCYFYEIYVDFNRQKMRIKMNDKIIEYQEFNKLAGVYSKKCIVYKIFRRKFFDGGNKNNSFFNISHYDELYVDIFHPMYLIYLVEFITVIIISELTYA